MVCYNVFGTGTLDKLMKWRDITTSEGHKIGYYVNESISYLILKENRHLETAKPNLKKEQF